VNERDQREDVQVQFAKEALFRDFAQGELGDGVRPDRGGFLLLDVFATGGGRGHS